MKKKYMKPQIEVMKIATNQFMCYSGEYAARQYNVYEDEDY